MKKQSHQHDVEGHVDYLETIYKRHFRGALVRSSTSVIMWLFALAAFFTGIINIGHFEGISLSVAYLILMNPPTLLLMKRITQRRLYRYISLLISFLETLGYTAIIYFLGGIDAAYLTPIFAALITYVGAMSPWNFPYIIAIMCSTALSFVVVGDHFGLLPHYAIIQSFDLPWIHQLARLLVVIALLFVVAYISSLTATTLRKNRDKLRRQNLELMEKTGTLEEAENELRIAHQKLETRVEIRTIELARANEALESELEARKQIEDTLRNSEEKHRLIFENSVDVIYSVDKELRIIDVSPSIEKTLGYSPSEVMGRPVQELGLLAPESLESAFSDIMRVLGGTTIPRASYTFIAKDGTRRYAEVSGSPMRRNGEIVGLISVARDITERKKADTELRKAYEHLRAADEQMQAQYNSLVESEKSLRESEEKYRTILENIEEGYLEVDLTGRLTFFNEAAQKFLGYSAEETMGMHYKQYADAENARKIYTAYKEVYRTGVPLKQFEWEVTRKDGSRRTVEGSAYLIRNIEGQPIGFRGLFRDITDSKHLQEERQCLQERLQRAEKMEALGTLAGGVAHDLNNVLGIVVGYSELLLDDIDESSKIRSYVMNMKSSGERAVTIVQDLLTLARRGVQTRVVLNLNTTINDFQKSSEFEKMCSFHPNVQIKPDLKADLLNITGSPVHLSKTFFNLVSNASEAMPDGGILTIKTTNEYLDKPIRGYDEVREGDYVVLSVSDTGEGIQAADLKRIFEPFYTKKVMGRSGTGLGLAVVWGTVKDHNGYINVQSEEGKGSTFTLYFPVTKEDIPAERIAVDISEYTGKGESILIVDDVEGQRELASQMLKKLDYIAATASSGEEALEYLKTNKAALIILDMIMDPGMDGLDTYKKVLEIYPKQKAIIVSGFSETDRVTAAQTLGAGAYVRKPYDIEKLGLAVRNELDRSK